MNPKKMQIFSAILIALSCGDLVLHAKADDAVLNETEKTLIALKAVQTIDSSAGLLQVTLKNDSPKEVMVNILSIRSPSIGISTGSFNKSKNNPYRYSQMPLADTSLKEVVLNGTKINVLEETKRPLGAGQSISISYDLSAIKEKISDIFKKHAPKRADSGKVEINIKFRNILSPPVKGMSDHTSTIVTPFVGLSMD